MEKWLQVETPKMVCIDCGKEITRKPFYLYKNDIEEFFSNSQIPTTPFRLELLGLLCWRCTYIREGKKPFDYNTDVEPIVAEKLEKSSMKLNRETWRDEE